MISLTASRLDTPPCISYAKYAAMVINLFRSSIFLNSGNEQGIKILTWI
jgi:hypothetical protein